MLSVECNYFETIVGVCRVGNYFETIDAVCRV